MPDKIILRWIASACQQSARFGPAVFLLVLGFGGCGGEQAFRDASHPDVVSSALLAPHLQASRESLQGSDGGDTEVRRDLERFAFIQQNLYDNRHRAAAADSFFALWRARPDHVLWPELEFRERRFLGDGRRSAEILAQPACADTSTAIGAYVLGWQLYSSGRFKSQFAIARSRSAGLDPFSSVWIDLKAAFGERLGGHPERSIPIALDALPSAREIGGRRLEALVWEEIARAMLASGNLDDALLAVDMADTLAVTALRPGDAVTGRLQIRALKAGILAARRDVRESISLYEAIISSALDLNLAYVASWNVNRAAMLAEAVGDRERLLDYSLRGLRFALSDRDSLNVPRQMMNIALYHRLRGDLDSCLTYQDEAARWVAAYPDPANVARMPLMQAEYYAQIGEYAVVDSLLNAAAGLSDNKSTAEARAELHLELIRGWMETDRPDLIYRSIDAISDLRYGSGDVSADRHAAADLNLLIGEFLTRRGEYALAGESLDMAAAALDRRSSPARSWTLARNRGLLARERGSLSAAEEAFRECIERGIELGVPEYESTGRFLLGSVLLAQGRYAEARSAFPATDEAGFVGRFTTRVSAILLTGMSYAAEGSYDPALAAFAEARQACRSWSPTELLARIDLETGRAHAAAGRFAEAQKHYDDVFTRLESADGISASPELAYFNGDLRRDLVEAYTQLPVADAAATLRLARDVMPHWRSPEPARDLQTDGPLIVFFVGERSSGRWVVANDSVHWLSLPGERALDDMLAPVLADLSEPGRAVAESHAGELAKTLLSGLAGVWQSGQTLAIVPDLSLYGVPWAALPLPEGEGGLIDHGPLVVLDKPASVRGGEGRHRPSGRLLSIGANMVDATRAAAGLTPLRHAEREAGEVASIWPADRSILRTGSSASRALTENAELDAFEAIHVASHAMVYDGDSGRTTLVLTGEDQDAMTASRIRNLDLSADLVYLSCCEAADGRDRRAGYAGLARSFLDAGARNVVAPLAVIDDEAAGTLALRFHGHWLAGLPVADALAAAQRDLRDGDPRWSHPFYWAFYQAIASDTPAGG